MNHIPDDSSPEIDLLCVQRRAGKRRRLTTEITYFDASTRVINKPQQAEKLTQTASSRTKALIARGLLELFSYVFLDRSWRVACAGDASANQCWSKNPVIPRISAVVHKSHKGTHRRGNLFEVSYLIGKALHPDILCHAG